MQAMVAAMEYANRIENQVETLGTSPSPESLLSSLNHAKRGDLAQLVEQRTHKPTGRFMPRENIACFRGVPVAIFDHVG